MILSAKLTSKPNGCILHVCGGDPICILNPHTNFEYSPRVWRWSLFLKLRSFFILVFSTCVEVILQMVKTLTICKSILHVCGGDPNPSMQGDWDLKYSPRVWRWSWVKYYVDSRETVFSTCVEVILLVAVSLTLTCCILHVCGGDPSFRWKILLRISYSPRVWRWSLQYKKFN